MAIIDVVVVSDERDVDAGHQFPEMRDRPRAGDGHDMLSPVQEPGDGQILIGNGTTITSQAIGGDATLANDGTLDLVAGAVEDDEVEQEGLS